MPRLVQAASLRSRCCRLSVIPGAAQVGPEARPAVAIVNSARSLGSLMGYVFILLHLNRATHLLVMSRNHLTLTSDLSLIPGHQNQVSGSTGVGVAGTLPGLGA